MALEKTNLRYIPELGGTIELRVLLSIIFLSTGCAPEHIPAGADGTSQPKVEAGPNGPLITEVKRFLGRCDACHVLEGVPGFKEWPIGGDLLKHPRWIISIRRSMGLTLRPRTMPPTSSPWQPTPAEMAMLKQWYDLGAPNQ